MRDAEHRCLLRVSSICSRRTRWAGEREWLSGASILLGETLCGRQRIIVGNQLSLEMRNGLQVPVSKRYHALVEQVLGDAPLLQQ